MVRQSKLCVWLRKTSTTFLKESIFDVLGWMHFIFSFCPSSIEKFRWAVGSYALSEGEQKFSWSQIPRKAKVNATHSMIWSGVGGYFDQTCLLLLWMAGADVDILYFTHFKCWMILQHVSHASKLLFHFTEDLWGLCNMVCHFRVMNEKSTWWEGGA